MELPVMDLRDRIEDEIEKNPALEIVKDKSTVSLEHEIGKDEKRDLRDYKNNWETYEKRGGDEHNAFIEGALAKPETLQEHLLWGLALEPCTSELRKAAELVIQNLDEDGFHIVSPETIPGIGDAATVQAALSIVQRIDPAGCGTKDYRESLLVQAIQQQAVGEDDLLVRALRLAQAENDFLPLFDKGRLNEAARRLGCTRDEAEALFEELKSLNPFPGRQFSGESARVVTPDIQVQRGEDDFVIVLNDETIPVLGVNPFFLKIEDETSGRGNAKTPEKREARDFVRENIKEARWFIQSINERNHTLLRVTRAIAVFQREFFEKGPKYIRPLRIGEIAEELGLADSTVSRTASSKYVQTDWGVYPLRYFFTNSITGQGSIGSNFSKQGVKEFIKEILDSAAAAGKKISDQAVADELEEKGIKIARRTVAKYRNEL
jgi:RNA polymerase sigma-54 factor